MEKPDISLPPEVLSIIFEYLPSSDIANCSKVCLRWREEINRNELWRRLCLHHGWAEVLDQPGAWSETTPRVEPHFKPPDSEEGSRLSPLCSWHLDFLQCAHLYKNWKNGLYAIQNFDGIVSQYLGQVLITSVDLNRKFVILGDDSGHVSIWEQARDIPKFLETVKCLFHNTVVSEIFLEDTSFAVIQLGLLQIYHKNDEGKYNISFISPMVKEAPELPFLLPGNDDEILEDWFVENVYEFFEEEEFRYTRACPDPILAFWGTVKSVDVLCLKPGGSLKTLKIPYEKYLVCDVAFGSHSSVIFIAIVNDNAGYIILEISLETDVCLRQFCDTSTIRQIHVNYNFLVSVNSEGIFTIWDCVKGGKMCVCPPLKFTLKDTYLGSFGDSLLYQCGHTIGSILHRMGMVQFSKFDIKQSRKFLSKGMGDLLILRNKANVEVWSFVDNKLMYSIQGILRKDDRYTAWCNDACVVLWGYDTAPIVIWFW